MLRLTLDLLPEGNARRARMLGRVDVFNSGEGSETHGHYVAELHEADRTSRRVSVGLLARSATAPLLLAVRALNALGYMAPERAYEAMLAGIGERLRELLARELSWSDEEIERHVVAILTGKKDGS